MQTASCRLLTSRSAHSPAVALRCPLKALCDCDEDLFVDQNLAMPLTPVQGMHDVLQWLSVALPAAAAGMRSKWERLVAHAGGSTTIGADAELKAHLEGVLELADGTLALANVVMLSSTWLNAVGAEQFLARRDRMRAHAKAPLSWLLTHLANLVPQLSGTL